jgi:hypothetical protein|tara:strand:+ start:450 stop:674 length:225 start_codon:yes stop_codon:yes gene_type:complete
MCIGGFGKTTVVQAVDPIAREEAAERKRVVTEQRKTRKQESLAQTVEATTRGVGRRSLITGPGGGMGYFNRYRT